MENSIKKLFNKSNLTAMVFMVVTPFLVALVMGSISNISSSVIQTLDIYIGLISLISFIISLGVLKNVDKLNEEFNLRKKIDNLSSSITEGKERGFNNEIIRHLNQIELVWEMINNSFFIQDANDVKSNNSTMISCYNFMVKYKGVIEDYATLIPDCKIKISELIENFRNYDNSMCFARPFYTILQRKSTHLCA